MQDTPRKTPGRNAQGEETRARALAAAGKVFATRGFGGASFRIISAESGVGLSTIAYHFGSKDALFLEAIRHFTLELGNLDRHFELLFAADTNDPQAIANALRDCIASFLHACHGPDAVPYLNEFYLRVITDGDDEALGMLFACFAGVQERLNVLFKTLRPDLDELRVAFLHQLLWSLLQYTVVGKRMILHDMKLGDDYPDDYLAAAANEFAGYCCLALALPRPTL